MGKLRAEIVAHLVAHDGDIATEFMAARQQGGGAGQRLQPLEVDAIKRLVENLLRFAGARANGVRLAMLVLGLTWAAGLLWS